MQNLKEKRILVTGGAGFIGSEVVRQLDSQNASVTVLDNFSSGRIGYINNFKNVRIIRGDILNGSDLSGALKDQEMIIHLAALPFIPDSYNFPQEFFKINTIGSVNLIWQSICAESIEKIVHISTSEVYGTAKYVPMDEEHPTLPHSTYAVSKLAAERAAFTMHKEHNFPIVILRPFNSYGPNVTQPYIIPEIISQLNDGNNQLNLGNIESSRDFTFVTDTAKGIIKALTIKEAIGKTINLGSASDLKIKDLVNVIANIMNKKVSIVSEETRFRPYDVNRLLSSNEMAYRILGWRPNISLEDGLKITIDWVKKNGVILKEPFKGWISTYKLRQSKKS